MDVVQKDIDPIPNFAETLFYSMHIFIGFSPSNQSRNSPAVLQFRAILALQQTAL